MNDSLPKPNGSGRSLVAAACAMLLVIAAFYVLREHWSHVAGRWPYLLLLACPLMHLFMYRGHRHHSQSRPRSPD